MNMVLNADLSYFTSIKFTFGSIEILLGHFVISGFAKSASYVLQAYMRCFKQIIVNLVSCVITRQKIVFLVLEVQHSIFGWVSMFGSDAGPTHTLTEATYHYSLAQT